MGQLGIYRAGHAHWSAAAGAAPLSFWPGRLQCNVAPLAAALLMLFHAALLLHTMIALDCYIALLFGLQNGQMQSSTTVA